MIREEGWISLRREIQPNQPERIQEVVMKNSIQVSIKNFNKNLLNLAIRVELVLLWQTSGLTYGALQQDYSTPNSVVMLFSLTLWRPCHSDQQRKFTLKSTRYDQDMGTTECSNWTKLAAFSGKKKANSQSCCNTTMTIKDEFSIQLCWWRPIVCSQRPSFLK